MGAWEEEQKRLMDDRNRARWTNQPVTTNVGQSIRAQRESQESWRKEQERQAQRNREAQMRVTNPPIGRARAEDFSASKSGDYCNRPRRNPSAIRDAFYLGLAAGFTAFVYFYFRLQITNIYVAAFYSLLVTIGTIFAWLVRKAILVLAISAVVGYIAWVGGRAVWFQYHH